MVLRKNSGSKLRQRVHLRRKIQHYDTRDPDKLARQLHELENGLQEMVNTAVDSALLRIRDRTRRPGVLLPERPVLSVSGNVTVQDTPDEVRLHFPLGEYLVSLDGVDGATVTGTATAKVVRWNHTTITPTISSVTTAWAPTDMATAGVVKVSATGAFQLRSIEVPGVDDVHLKRMINVSSETLVVVHESGDETTNTQRRVHCPGNTNYSWGPSESFWLYFDRSGTPRWRVLGKDTSGLVSTLTGVDGVSVTGSGSSRTARRSYNVITPSITANQTDWSPTNLSTADIMCITADATRTIHSIVAPSGTDTRGMWLVNTSGAGINVILAHNSSGVNENRFFCPENQNFTLAYREAIWIWYDPTSGVERWRIGGMRALRLSGGTMDAGAPINMNGGDIEDVDDIVMVGSGSVIDLNTGTIVDVSTLTMASGGRIVMSDGEITELDYIDWNSGASVGTPAAGFDRMGVDTGAPFVIPGALNFGIKVPLVVRSGTSTGADIDIDFNLSSLRGITLTGGAFCIECLGMSVPPTDGTDIGGVMLAEYFFWRTDATNVWTRDEIRYEERGYPTSSRLVDALMTSDTNLRISINGSAITSGMRYLGVAYITGRGRTA